MSRGIDYSPFVARYLNGETTYGIAAEIGVNASTVYRGLKKLGVKMRNQGTRNPNKKYNSPQKRKKSFDYEQAKKLYESGLNLRETADSIGVSTGAVRMALDKTGVKRRKPGFSTKAYRSHSSLKGKPNFKSRKYDHHLMIEMYQSGASLFEIGAEIGCNSETIRQALSMAGIERRSKGASHGKNNHQFKGGTRITINGYRVKRGKRNPPLEHRVIAEAAIGRPLKTKEVVHHINRCRSDNRNSNLLICTQEYHIQLHQRMRNHPYWSQLTVTR
jgi:hypothetical protein